MLPKFGRLARSLITLPIITGMLAIYDKVLSATLSRVQMDSIASLLEEFIRLKDDPDGDVSQRQGVLNLKNIIDAGQAKILEV